MLMPARQAKPSSTIGLLSAAVLQAPQACRIRPYGFVRCGAVCALAFGDRQIPNPFELPFTFSEHAKLYVRSNFFKNDL